MAKALDVNDSPAQNPAEDQGDKSGEKANKQQLQGKALQVNENTVEGGDPAKTPPPRPQA